MIVIAFLSFIARIVKALLSFSLHLFVSLAAIISLGSLHRSSVFILPSRALRTSGRHQTLAPAVLSYPRSSTLRRAAKVSSWLSLQRHRGNVTISLSSLRRSLHHLLQTPPTPPSLPRQHTCLDSSAHPPTRILRPHSPSAAPPYHPEFHLAKNNRA